MDLLIILGGYLLLTNFITYLVFGLDKKRAIDNEWRIPEASLLGLAFLGGSIGAYLGMKSFHHKTKKLKFSVGIPMMIATHVFIVVYMMTLLYL